jgi:predicted ATPase
MTGKSTARPDAISHNGGVTKPSGQAGVAAIAAPPRSGPSASVLSVSVLRGVEATFDMQSAVENPVEIPVEISGQRLRALLALLALTPGVARRADYLADQLWDGRPPSANALQALVSRLRRVLGAEAVVSRPNGYALAIDPERVDVVRFDRLVHQGTAQAARQALALAGPEPLAEFPDVPDLADEARRIEADCWRLRDLAAAEPEPPAQQHLLAAAPPRGPAPRRLIGRDRLLAEIGERLAETRLLTLVGAGGAGKTSLARHLAHQAAQAVFVELAPVTAAQVPAEALIAVGGREVVLRERIGPAAERQDARERLAASIGSRPLLLVLDNCEHVISAAAELAAYLLDRCAAVTILATSREPLAVPGELRLPIDPLAVPPRGSAAQELPGYSAVELLTERGRAVRPGVSSGADGDEIHALAEICRRLDGIPLALELAAARFNSLSPRQVADRLDDRFSLLTKGARTALPRQQTLRAVVDWSWDLLDHGERELLMISAVFLGGALFEDLEAVAGFAILDPLDRLVAKSLVVAEDQAGRMRYRLLETIREYALERLAEAGQADRIRQAHAEFYAQLAKTADGELRGPEQMTWLARLDAEQDNIRVALATALDQSLLATALAICGRMGWYAQLRGQSDLRGPLVRTTQLARRAPLPEPTEDLGRTYMFHAMSGLETGMPIEEAGRWLARARLIYRRIGGHYTIAVALDCALAMFKAETFPLVLARADAECSAAGDVWGLAMVRMFWARMSADEDVDRAEQLGRAAVGLFRECGDRWGIAAGGEALALVESIKGNHRAAIEAFAESLNHARVLGAAEDQAQIMGLIACEYEYLEEPGRADGYLAEAGDFIASLGHQAPSSVHSFLLLLNASIQLRRGDLQAAEAALAEVRELAAGVFSFGFKVRFETVAGAMAAAAGRDQEALDCFTEALDAGSQFHFDRAELAEAIEGIAAVAANLGRPVLGARLLGAAVAMRPVPLPPTRARAALLTEARLREMLAPGEFQDGDFEAGKFEAGKFEAGYAEGRDCPVPRVVEIAREAIEQLRA